MKHNLRDMQVLRIELSAYKYVVSQFSFQLYYNRFRTIIAKCDAGKVFKNEIVLKMTSFFV